MTKKQLEDLGLSKEYIEHLNPLKRKIFLIL